MFKLLMILSAAGLDLYLMEIGVNLMQYIYLNAFIVCIMAFSYIHGTEAE